MGAVILYLLLSTGIVICLVVGITYVISRSSRNKGYLFLGLSALISLFLLTDINPLPTGVGAHIDYVNAANENFYRTFKTNLTGAWRIISSENNSSFIALYNSDTLDGPMNYYRYNGVEIIEGEWMPEDNWIQVLFEKGKPETHVVNSILNDTMDLNIYQDYPDLGEEIKMVRINNKAELIKEMNRIRK